MNTRKQRAVASVMAWSMTDALSEIFPVNVLLSVS
jgi:hypothetical protein